MKNSDIFEEVSRGTSKRRIPLDAIKKNAFCQKKQPLGCIYLPRKIDRSPCILDIEINSIPPAEALIELIRYSFIPPYLTEKMGWQASRLEFFARLVKQIPVRRLIYPAGLEHLPRVTEAVMADLEKLPST